MGSCLWPVKGSSWSLSRSFGKPLGGLLVSVWGLLGSLFVWARWGSKLDVSNITLITINNKFNPDLIYRTVYS